MVDVYGKNVFVETFFMPKEYHLHRHAFMQICYVNNISLAKYIYYNTKFIDIEIIDVVFEKACTNGTYHLIQWLYDIYKKYDKTKLSDKTKFLWRKRKEQNTIENGFQVACINRQINIAKWISEKNNNCKLYIGSEIHQISNKFNANDIYEFSYAWKTPSTDYYFNLIKNDSNDYYGRFDYLTK